MEICKVEKAPFKEDESDFNVPLSSYYRLIKKNPLDPQIIQIKKEKHLKPVPKFDWDKIKKEYEQNKSLHPENDAPGKEADKPNAGAEETKEIAIVEEPKAEEKRGKGKGKQPDVVKSELPQTTDSIKDPKVSPPMNIDEEPKKTGCSCL